MKSSPAAAPYFVLAHHRSGSNFLNDLLQAHPRIECINEPFSMHTRYFRECDLAPWSKGDFDTHLFHPALARHDALRGYLSEFREYLLQSGQHRIIGFKDTVFFEKLEWLKEFMPSLKIVFLKRDLRCIVSSLLRSNLLEFWNYADLVPPAFTAMHPHYVSRDPDGGGDGSTRLAEIAAMSVVTRYSFAQRHLRLFDHKVLYLDALMGDPEGHLQDITAFLGVDPDEAPLSFIRRRQSASRGGTFSSFRTRDDVSNTWQRHLSPAQIQVIDDVLQAAGFAH
jgi:hypothetical protein